jgi:hypothetical protein
MKYLIITRKLDGSNDVDEAYTMEDALRSYAEQVRLYGGAAVELARSLYVLFNLDIVAMENSKIVGRYNHVVWSEPKESKEVVGEVDGSVSEKEV